MALYHNATLEPSKADLIAGWISAQSWCPTNVAPFRVIGAFRFDDPEGRVGMETHLVSVGDVVLQVPLTYREEPLAGAEEALIGEMDHSALGTRWVYDGLRDPKLVMMLAAATMTGQGEAIGMIVYGDRWHIAPSSVRIAGGGWTQGRVPVDGFKSEDYDGDTVLLRNDRFELSVFRRPRQAPRPAIGLTATWEGLAGSVVLAEMTERSAPLSR